MHAGSAKRHEMQDSEGVINHAGSNPAVAHFHLMLAELPTVTQAKDVPSLTRPPPPSIRTGFLLYPWTCCAGTA
jgi:hypothetical protein